MTEPFPEGGEPRPGRGPLVRDRGGEELGARARPPPWSCRTSPRTSSSPATSWTAWRCACAPPPGSSTGSRQGDVSAQIDLAGAGEGERIVHLTPQAIRVPFGVEVVKVTPSIVTLNFERTLQRTVPVRPRLLGRPAAGYEVAEVTSDPAEVAHRGAQEPGAGDRERVHGAALRGRCPGERGGHRHHRPRRPDAAPPRLQPGQGDRPRTRGPGEAHVRGAASGGARDGRHRCGRRRFASPWRARPRSCGGSGRRTCTPSSPWASDQAGAERLKVAVDLGQEGLNVVETEPAEVTVRPASGRRSP